MKLKGLSVKSNVLIGAGGTGKMKMSLAVRASKSFFLLKFCSSRQRIARFNYLKRVFLRNMPPLTLSDKFGIINIADLNSYHSHDSYIRKFVSYSLIRIVS